MMIEFVDGFLSKNICKCCIKPEDELAAHGQAVGKGRGHRRLAVCHKRVFSCLNFWPSFPKSPSTTMTAEGRLPLSSGLKHNRLIAQQGLPLALAQKMDGQ